MMETKTALGACVMGQSSDKPCPYPAVSGLSAKLPDGYGVCAFHLATEPLVDESEMLNHGLDALATHLKAARSDHNTLLVAALKRVRGDFADRLKRVDKVLDDLHNAEMRYMRS